MAAARYLFVGLSAAAPDFGAVHAVDGVKALVAAAGMPLRVPAPVLQAYADALASRTIDFRGGAVSRLMTLMAQADDARARERGPFWSEAA